MATLQPLGEFQSLPFNLGSNYSIESLLVAPLRFCGRQWRLIENNNNQISQVALNILTVLSIAPAAVATLFFSSDNNLSFTEHNPISDYGLLDRASSNEQIAEKIKESLLMAGEEYSVEVRSKERAEINDDYHPGKIHRYITLVDPSSTAATRFWKRIENHFYGKNVPSLNSLHSCLYGQATEEDFDNLADVLALHESVTFSMAFDLAYIRTEIGRGSTYGDRK